MDDKKTTSAYTSNIPVECVTHQEITDKFKIMIRKALKATKMVLLERCDDLLHWSKEDKNEFRTIFGFDGDNYVNVKKYGENTGRQIKARFLMADGIRRLMVIANELNLDSFKNYTKCERFAAFVSPDLDPPYIINIGAHFESRKGSKILVTGNDSHVSTICHEISHIIKYWKDNSKGGMWTQDYTAANKFSTSDKDEVSYEKHVLVAQQLVDAKEEQLFENAYNIERYFYIKLNDNDIDAKDEDLLNSDIVSRIGLLEEYVGSIL
ncbi:MULTISPECIES: peptidase M35 [Buttiauxella]|uniref:peptidase M35 n=1 Tax=Buttiauxella TaxID=82976 RepID=UPI00155FF3CC|nr:MULTISPECIES: peptidase M35 [Buttiauxella]MCS3602613.1 hypothetical protein [Buttiauxella sp. BIGb0471]BCG09858.1 hypothetical protein BADSM9389_25290 [Buttiauxella agrestis]